MPPRHLSAARVLLAALVAVAAAVRLAQLGAESYWFDEIHSVLQARLAFGAMISDLVVRDVHPPLFPALLWIWARLVGEGEAVARILPAVIGTAALVPLFAIGRMLYGTSTGLVAALLLALNSYAVFYARELRPYSLLLLAALLATWLLLRWIERPEQHGRAAAYVAAAAALAYTHNYGLLLLLAHGLFVLGWLPPLGRRFILAACAVAALYAPWLPALLRHVAWVQREFWLPPIQPGDPIQWAALWAGFSRTLGVIFGGLILLGALVQARPETIAGQVLPVRPRPLLLLWVALPLGVPIVTSLVGEPAFSPKCASVSFGAFALLAARGLMVLPGRLSPVATAALAAVLALQVPLEIHLTRRKAQWREIAALAEAEAKRGTLVATDRATRRYLRFYLPDTEIAALGNPPDLDRLAARASCGRVLYVMVHPARSPHEATLGRRWRILEEHELIKARGVAYAVPGRRACEREQTDRSLYREPEEGVALFPQDPTT